MLIILSTSGPMPLSDVWLLPGNNVAGIKNGNIKHENTRTKYKFVDVVIISSESLVSRPSIGFSLMAIERDERSEKKKDELDEVPLGE